MEASTVYLCELGELKNKLVPQVYWISQDFEDQRDQALTPSQPFVYNTSSLYSQSF